MPLIVAGKRTSRKVRVGPRTDILSMRSGRPELAGSRQSVSGIPCGTADEWRWEAL